MSSYHYATELYGAYGEAIVNAAFQRSIVQCPGQHYTMHGGGMVATAPSPTTTAIPQKNWKTFTEIVREAAQRHG